MKRLLVLQHLEIEGPGLFYQIAKEREMNIEIIRLDQGDELPKTNKDDLLLIMGGPMGVKDIGSTKYPWLKKESDFIKSELKKKDKYYRSLLRSSVISKRSRRRCRNFKTRISS